MAPDLALSLFCLFSGAMVVFVASARAFRSASSRERQFAAIVIVLCGAVYGLWGWDQIWLSTFIPASTLIVLGNWLPLFAAALAGIAVRATELPLWRRGFCASGMLAAGFYAAAFPILGTSPLCTNNWQDSICLQSTPFSCSAASTATLLRAHGIAATEQEMAELCLTSHKRNGTSWQGVFRGLSLKTEGTDWKVEVFKTARGQVNADQAARFFDRPALLVACLPTDEQVDPMYQEACGWIPGQPHAVVFFEMRDDHTAVIGDPQFGRELWTRDDLGVLWSGLGFRLVPRSTKPR